MCCFGSVCKNTSFNFSSWKCVENYHLLKIENHFKRIMYTKFKYLLSKQFLLVLSFNGFMKPSIRYYSRFKGFKIQSKFYRDGTKMSYQYYIKNEWTYLLLVILIILTFSWESWISFLWRVYLRIHNCHTIWHFLMYSKMHLFQYSINCQNRNKISK